MKLRNRVERLESAMGFGGTEAQYADRADYNDHESYVVGPDGSCMYIPALNKWPDEAALWSTHPGGTKFIRLNGDEVTEVIDGVSRVVRVAPVKITSDTRRALDELYRDITGMWPETRKTKP